MQLSLITPVEYLQYTSLLPGRFALAPVAREFATYHDYFAAASEAGYKVILDNGIFENDKVANDDYLDLVRSIKPQVLVIPDTINANAVDNWNEAIAFVAKVKEANLPWQTELMFVIQCEKEEETSFWDTLDKALDTSEFEYIGICRDAVYNAFGHITNTEDQELNRFYFAAALQKRYNTVCIGRKKWHFLGMGNRIDLLQYYWFVDSMDTASLFYQATLGVEITNEFFLPAKLKRPQDYFGATFLNEAEWARIVNQNCYSALVMAQQADVNRRLRLGGGRL